LRTLKSFRRDLTTSFPARSNDDEFSDKADRLYKLRQTRRSLSLRNYKGDVVENMCGDMHIKYLTLLKARTILVDGALREGEPLIPLPSFEIMSTERVEAIYPLLKDVALSPDMPFCAPEKFIFHLVTNAMKSWFAMNMDNLRGVTVEVQKFEAASTSSGSLDHLNPHYSPAATCVFFDVARTFSKSNCDNGL
ncbi:hypothetical protein HID58_053481, partial [Brassica napus]